MQAGLGATKMLLIRAGKSVDVFALSAASNEKIRVGEYSRHSPSDEPGLARTIVSDFAAKQKDTTAGPK
jgi:hypothetical protein